MPLSTIGRSPGAASWPRAGPCRRDVDRGYVRASSPSPPPTPLPAIGGRRAKSRCYLNPGFGCLRCSRRGRFVAWVMRRRLPARTGAPPSNASARRQGCPASDRWSRSGDQQHVGCQLQQPLQCDLWRGDSRPGGPLDDHRAGERRIGGAARRCAGSAYPAGGRAECRGRQGARRHRRFPRRLYVADEDSVAVAVRGAGRAGNAGGRLLPRLPVDLGLRRRL